MNAAVAEIAQRVIAASPPAPMRTKIVGIDGCGGAGKSTLARKLADRLGAQLIQTDDFASWDTPLDWHDRLLSQVLTPLHANRPGHYQRYDWGQRSLAEWHDVPVQDMVVLEGVSSTQALFRPMLAYAIFVDTPKDVRLKRGLDRDGAEALALWQSWQAEEDAYLRGETPADFADLILDGTKPIPDET